MVSIGFGLEQGRRGEGECPRGADRSQSYAPHFFVALVRHYGPARPISFRFRGAHTDELGLSADRPGAGPSRAAAW